MKKWIIGALLLLILGFSPGAGATVTADISEEYMPVGWSSDETRVLAVVHKHEPEIINEKVRLVDYEPATGRVKILAELANMPEQADLRDVAQNPVFAAIIAEHVRSGYKQGESCSGPRIPSGGQTVEIRKNNIGYQVVLRRQGDTSAGTAALDLTDWVHSLKAGKIYELKIQNIFLSPSGQKALLQIRAAYHAEADKELINRTMLNLKLQ